MNIYNERLLKCIADDKLARDHRQAEIDRLLAGRSQRRPNRIKRNSSALLRGAAYALAAFRNLPRSRPTRAHMT